MKSKRNKTIDFSLDDAPADVLAKIIHVKKKDPLSLRQVTDKVINGDSFQIMSQLPANSIDLALIDPPYNLNKKYDGMTFKQMKTAEYQEYTEQWIQKLQPLLKATASVYVFADWQTSIALAPVLGKYFTIKNRITWQREKGRGALTNWKNSSEDIWFLTVKPHDYTFNVNQVKQRRQVIAPYKENGHAKDWQATKAGNFRDTMPSNLWDDISIPYWSMPENTNHPTQKPEKLMAKVILASSNPGDLILDPFAGAGSSLVTAKKLNRHFIGIEQSLLYCTWGQYRLDKTSDDPHIQGYTDGVFWPRNSVGLQKKFLNHSHNS
ncbi:MAG: site-specific DNA-methyltransferase [Limosilactobacillus sp.]|uniref:DNA-methyltransferase n=1 Tax=Limosilactobacillus sp. TaxID=2773925 RepID=UPI0025B8E178|nr:DNA methyltransferase [Limosilactobacillus sp.]MCI1974711.1 site-specific DNA-methyltransferase [Limosilactobacillus sp.]MCI2030877.1 site-specific DNA-methyltransferase [Limosilactobacillus sp.]